MGFCAIYPLSRHRFLCVADKGIGIYSYHCGVFELDLKFRWESESVCAEFGF